MQRAVLTWLRDGAPACNIPKREDCSWMAVVVFQELSGPWKVFVSFGDELEPQVDRCSLGSGAHYALAGLAGASGSCKGPAKDSECLRAMEIACAMDPLSGGEICMVHVPTGRVVAGKVNKINPHCLGDAFYKFA